MILSYPKSRRTLIALIALTALIVLLILIGIFSNGWDQGLMTFLYWIIVNASCTLITTAVAAAHPLNILLCAITAPFFALNPVLGVGMLFGSDAPDSQNMIVRSAY